MKGEGEKVGLFMAEIFLVTYIPKTIITSTQETAKHSTLETPPKYFGQAKYPFDFHYLGKGGEDNIGQKNPSTD